MNIRPLHDRLVVRRLEAKETAKGGIIALTRKLSLAGPSIEARYTLVNLAPFPFRFVWAQHALLSMTGQFLIKDVALLGVAVWTLADALGAGRVANHA